MKWTTTIITIFTLIVSSHCKLKKIFLRKDVTKFIIIFNEGKVPVYEDEKLYEASQPGPAEYEQQYHDSQFPPGFVNGQCPAVCPKGPQGERGI